MFFSSSAIGKFPRCALAKVTSCSSCFKSFPPICVWKYFQLTINYTSAPLAHFSFQASVSFNPSVGRRLANPLKKRRIFFCLKSFCSRFALMFSVIIQPHHPACTGASAAGYPTWYPAVRCVDKIRNFPSIMVELSVPWGRKAALNDDAHTDALQYWWSASVCCVLCRPCWMFSVAWSCLLAIKIFFYWNHPNTTLHFT